MAESEPTIRYPNQLDGNNHLGRSLLHRGLVDHESSPLDSFVSDADGYMVMKDTNSSNFVYAKKNNISGKLVSSGIVVGRGDPKTVGMTKSLRPFSSVKHNGRRLLGHAPTVGAIKNLVILMRFQNHKTRILPTGDDFDVLFNHEGDDNHHHDLAPTGSVRDVYRVNSYGKFTLESKIYGWVDLPETEAYYAAGVGGFATPEYMEALHSAMDALQKKFGLSDFSEFDSNKDGKIDMLTLVHSGYASEVNGADEDGAVNDDRIWSHHRKLPRKRRWYPDPENKKDGAYVYQYATVPALYGGQGSSIGRVGVICHEIGHAIGMPDLYGTSEGNGIGSYDFMANHWGFPPYFHLSQLYPPILSPWSKMKVGWLDPIVIDKSGTFNITASQLTDQIYRINIDETETEYLLIENRQAIGFDSFLPQGGLAIWHIDENAENVEGFPGQAGIPWPLNNKHYKVSLLQADGNYDLEQKRNNGDKFDLFHGDGVDFLSPSVNFVDGPYPSTDSYKDTLPVRTGIMIHGISSSDLSMSFSVNLMRELSSSFLGGNGASGTMFDVLPTKDIEIRKLYLNLAKEESVSVELWTRTGTHVSYENKPWLWQRSAVVGVDGNGRGKKSCMDLESGALVLNANTRYGIYLVLTRGKFRYTNGEGVGNVVASNNDLAIYEGSGLSRPFGRVFQNRIWNGDVFYDVLSEDDSSWMRGRRKSRRLETAFDGGSGQDGIMFDVSPKDNNLRVHGFDLRLADTHETDVRIYTKEGSFTGSENQPWEWTPVANATVVGKGVNLATKVVLDPEAALHMSSNQVRAFYIVVAGNKGNGLRYTRGSRTGTQASSNENLIIFEGVGVASEFGPVFPNRIWNGALHYEVVDVDSSP